MKLIAGLGNPGRRYAGTRHNLGFMVVEELAHRAGVQGSRVRFQSEVAEGDVAGHRLVFLKPQTYMNLSGHAVREAVNWYKVNPDDVMIVIDDLALPFGSVRLRPKGSAGGHNGLASVLEQIGDQAVPRLRVGIGQGRGATVARVLSRFSKEEEQALPEVIDNAVSCLTVWLEEGIIPAMNRCNRRDTSEDPASADGG